MKKTVLFFMTCLLAVSCGTVKLALDTKAPDGTRLCATSDVTLFADEGDEIYTALGIKAGERDSLFAISITCNKQTEHALFRKGSRMTFTFEDGSEVALKNMMDSYMEVDNAPVLKSTPVAGVAYSYYYTPWAGLMYASPYEYHGYVPTPGVNRTSSSYALYLLGGDQLKSIMNKKATGCILEAGDRNFEMKQPENAGGLYTQLYEFLMEKVK